MTPTARRRVAWHRILIDRLERLRLTLDTLRDRLREALAQAVSDAVTGAIRETFRLAAPYRAPDPYPAYRPNLPTRRSSAWGEPDDAWD